mgnify:CR=1 FL=1
MPRASIQDFALANPVYAGATVTVYRVTAGVKTAIKITLYDSLTGAGTLLNPQTLDSNGKLIQAVYIDEDWIATVSGLTIADHDTGIVSNLIDTAQERRDIVWMQMNGSNWEVILPDGTSLDISASTTNGLQEALNYARNNGYHLKCLGGGSAGNSPTATTRGTIQCSSAISVGTLYDKVIEIDATVNFSSGVTGHAWTWDSFDLLRARIGQIIYQGTGAFMHFNQSGNVPIDNVPIQGYSTIEVAALARMGVATGSAGVKFTGNGNGFYGLKLRVQDLNGESPDGAGGYITAGVDLTAANGGMGACDIDIGIMHGVASLGWQEPNNAANIINNHFRAHVQLQNNNTTSFQIGSGGATGGNLYEISIADVSATGTTGIELLTGARRNKFIVPFNDADTQVTDNATTKDNTGMWGEPRGQGSDLTAAATLTVPAVGTSFHVTGATGITEIAVTGERRELSFIFDSNPVITDGNHLKMAGNFNTTADDTLTGWWDGTNFYETGRSAN